TSRLGTEAYNFFHRFSPEFADCFLAFQKSAVVYTEFQGLCLLPGARWQGNAIWYDSVRSTTAGELDEAVRLGDHIEVTGKHSFVVYRGTKPVMSMEDPMVCALPFV